MWNTSSTTMKIFIILTRLSVAACLSVFCTVPCFGRLAFSDITVTAGTGGPTAKDRLGGHGVMFTDVDKDGWADLYITMIFNKPMPRRDKKL